VDVSTVTDSLVAEYRLLTESVGLVDRSERGKLALTGAEGAVPIWEDFMRSIGEGSS